MKPQTHHTVNSEQFPCSAEGFEQACDLVDEQRVVFAEKLLA